MAFGLLIDVAPDRAGIGLLLAIILFVIAFVVLLAGVVVFLLWYRKHSARQLETTPAENDGIQSDFVHPRSPNQP